jgi:hypothetical protein
MTFSAQPMLIETETKLPEERRLQLPDIAAGNFLWRISLVYE